MPRVKVCFGAVLGWICLVINFVRIWLISVRACYFLGYGIVDFGMAVAWIYTSFIYFFFSFGD